MKHPKEKINGSIRLSKIRKQYKNLMLRLDQKNMSHPELQELEKDLYAFRLMVQGMQAELRTMINYLEEKQEWLDWGPDAWEVMDECLESLLDCLS